MSIVSKLKDKRSTGTINKNTYLMLTFFYINTPVYRRIYDNCNISLENLISIENYMEEIPLSPIKQNYLLEISTIS